MILYFEDKNLTREDISLIASLSRFLTSNYKIINSAHISQFLCEKLSISLMY